MPKLAYIFLNAVMNPMVLSGTFVVQSENYFFIHDTIGTVYVDVVFLNTPYRVVCSLPNLSATPGRSTATRLLISSSEPLPFS